MYVCMYVRVKCKPTIFPVTPLQNHLILLVNLVRVCYN